MVVGKYEDLGVPRERELERQNEEERQRVSKGITSAIAQGDVPPTELLNEAVEQARSSIATTQLNPTLSSEGRQVAGDLANVLGDVEQVLVEKNEGETLQKLAYHSREAAREAQCNAQKATDDLKEVIGIATDLARLVATSSEFRRLFQDLSVFVLELLSVKIEQSREAIEKHVDEERPLSESLKDVAKDVANQPLSRDEEPVTQKRHVEMKIDPQVDDDTKKKKEKGQFQSENQKREHGDKAAFKEEKDNEGQKGDSGPADKGKKKDDKGLGQEPGERERHGKLPADSKTDEGDWRQKLDEKDRKENEQESRRQRKEGEGFERSVVNDQLSEEDRRQLLARLRTWAKEIHKRTDFRKGVHDLFDALDDFRRHAIAAMDEATGMIRAVDPTSHRVQAQKEARRLLEQFAGGHSLEPTVQAMNQLVRSTKDDPRFDRRSRWTGIFGPEITQYFDRLGDFIKRCVDDPDYVQSDQVSRDLDQQIDEGNAILDAHRPELKSFLRHAEQFAVALSNDRTIHRLSSDTQKLIKRLFLDDQGRPTLKTGVLMDLRKILGPILRSQLAYIALPTIAYNDDSISWVMENVVLKGVDIVPDQIVVENYMRAVINPLSDAQDTAGSMLRIKVTGMRAHVHNVHFAYKRKVFPRMEDVCSFDAHIEDEGITIQMVLKLSNMDTKHVFRVSEVRCDIASFVLKNIHGVEHSNALYTFMKPIIQNNARSNLEESIVNTLFDWMWDLDQVLMEYRDYIQLS